MTIFYAGRVLVYDDFPNERAKEIMALADKGIRSSTTAAAAPPAAANRFVSALEKPNSNSPAGESNVVFKTQAPVPTMPAPEQLLKPQPEAKKSSGNEPPWILNFQDEWILVDYLDVMFLIWFWCLFFSWNRTAYC